MNTGNLLLKTVPLPMHAGSDMASHPGLPEGAFERISAWMLNRDGEQEMLEDILLSEPPESKILLSLLSGGVICAGALLVCWLSGSSPSGADVPLVSFCGGSRLRTRCIQHDITFLPSHTLVAIMRCAVQVERTCLWRAARRLQWAS